MSLAVLIFIFLLTTCVISAPHQRIITESIPSIEQCQSGRVCINSCYLNGQLVNCNQSYVVKSILFDPSFDNILPATHLKLIHLDSDDERINEDVEIEKDNLTSDGMNIRFNLLKNSIPIIVCVDWQACV